MVKRNLNKSGQKLIAAAVVACLMVSLTPAATQKSKARRSRTVTTSDPKDLFSLGFFYYNNDDIRDDKAANQFKRVIRDFPNSEDAERAQFFLGSYYQRKYYIEKDKYAEDDDDSIEDAIEEYETYIRRYPAGGPCQCLSDAHFNLALAYLQLGKTAEAQQQLGRMFESYGNDPAVYISQVVWSSNPKDAIDSHFDARRLAEYTLSISNESFDEIVTLLKRWCNGQKNRGH